MRTSPIALALLLVASAAYGCEDPMLIPDAATTTDAAVDAGPFDDQNDTPAEAVVLQSGTAVTAAIETPGDLDYYRFTANEGDWIVVFTEANPGADPAMIDTVLTLYDSAMSQLAENDDSVPKQDTDSEIIYRIPATGTYYVLVQEWTTWQDEPDEFGATFMYEVELLARPNVNPEYATFHDEAGADPQALHAVTATTTDYGVIAGVLDDATDTDVFSFTTTDTRRSTRFTVMPRGTDGYGSTALPARLWVTDEDGAIQAAFTPSAFEGNEDLDMEFSPSLATPGTYQLHVEHGGAAGANDFYVVKWARAQGNPLEDTTTETENGDPTTPAPLTLTADAQVATTRRGYVTAALPIGDTDHFSFTTMANEEVYVFCGAASDGSGVAGLRARVLDAADPFTERATAMEDPITGLAIRALAVPAGTYLLELTRGTTTRQTNGTDIAGDWVRCGVTVRPPAATP